MRPITVHQVDCLDVLAELDDHSIDAIITDPPYGLSSHSTAKIAEVISAWAAGDDGRVPKGGRGFMSAGWDTFVPPPAVWRECLRVLRPGGHLAAFAGSRTVDLMGLSLRLAGFDIRDSLAWIHGQGLPHGADIGKQVPGFTGWKTALKPAVEPIVLARAPMAGTAAANVAAHGTGALNIDACRIRHRNAADLAESAGESRHGDFGTAQGGNSIYGDFTTLGAKANYDGSAGRFPANVVISHSPECRQIGEKTVKSDTHYPAARPAGGIGITGHLGQTDLIESGSGSEVVTAFDCAPDCQVSALDGMSSVGDDVGGASRFFYCPKASSAERPKYIDDDGQPIQHMTVKPLELMRWLTRLLTPAGGTVLDPFAGSGTTIEAACIEGFAAIGIEREAEYIPLIRQRIERVTADDSVFTA